MTYAIMYRRTNTSEVWRGFLLHETKKHAEDCKKMLDVPFAILNMILSVQKY